MPVNSNSDALTGDGALDNLLPLIGPESLFMLELRHLGGALTHSRGVRSAVGHRPAIVNLFTSAYPGTPPDAAAGASRGSATQSPRPLSVAHCGTSCGPNIPTPVPVMNRPSRQNWRGSRRSGTRPTPAGSRQL
jgi:hypothetical protein